MRIHNTLCVFKHIGMCVYMCMSVCTHMRVLAVCVCMCACVCVFANLHVCLGRVGGVCC